jgi:rhamnosyltransferase
MNPALYSWSILCKNSMEQSLIQHVFIVGSKGIPARYGGYETFVENLTKHRISDKIRYHVACLARDNKTFEYNNSDCFDVKVPNIGPAKAVYYDVAAIKECIKYIRKQKIRHPIIYVLTCRIGPFFGKLVSTIHRLGGKVFLNPDGHEWMRAKWSKPVRKYWKRSEARMVKLSDCIICDSKNIEKYILSTYSKYSPKTTFIAYGSDVTPSTLKDDDPHFLCWLKENGLSINNYYLSVGRFVPENNFEAMIREFMKSNTTRDFAIMTTKDDKFFSQLKKKLHFEKDPRIKFVGTVYDPELLKKIRENAFAYLHGHSVGGTNPSLLEALGSTKLNLLYDVGFNREVAENSAIYWNMESGSLLNVINSVDIMDKSELLSYHAQALSRIVKLYSWALIINKYENVFLKTYE